MGAASGLWSVGWPLVTLLPQEVETQARGPLTVSLGELRPLL